MTATTAALTAHVQRLIDKALAEARAVWEPRLTAALLELEQERRKHLNYVEIANRSREADRQLIATLQRRNEELVDLLGSKAKALA